MPSGEVLSMIQSKAILPGCSKISLSLSRIRHLPLVCVIFYLYLVQIPTSEPREPSYLKTSIPVPHPITSLLRSKKVHKELELTAAETNEIEKVVSEIDLPLWRLRDLPLHERNEAANLLIKQLRDKLAQTLSDRQLERLNQLVWRARGIDVILEPEVALCRVIASRVQMNNIKAISSFDKAIKYEKLHELEVIWATLYTLLEAEGKE
jgi:hypothetical protein